MHKNRHPFFIKIVALIAMLFVSCACNTSSKEKDKETPKEYFLFVGNPGAGKSALINSLLQEKVAKSGLSFGGGGLTKKMQTFERGDKIYIDTPGLDDVEEKDRVQAAKEIENALKLDGKYHIFFVLTLEDGRVRPDDVLTIQLVMSAINLADKKYNIIINKVSKNLMTKIDQNPTSKPNIAQLLNKSSFKTSSIYYLPLDKAAEDTDEFVNLDDTFKKWFYEDSLTMDLKPSDLSEVSSDREKYLAKLEKELAELYKKQKEQGGNI